MTLSGTMALHAPVWCRSAHTYLVDSVFNGTLHIVTEYLRPTPTDHHLMHPAKVFPTLARTTRTHNNFTNLPLVNIFLTMPNAPFITAMKNFLFLLEVVLPFTFLLLKRLLLNLSIPFFFFSFQPFPLVRGGHSISSFSTSFCLQCPSPSHQLPAYLLLLHLKIFSLVSLFSSFLVTPFPSSFFLHTLGLSS